MSFAALRQTCLQKNVLDLAQFAEERSFTRRGGDTQTIRCKVAHERLGSRGGSRLGQVAFANTHDETERILVTVSRDSSWAFALPEPPQVGDALGPEPGDRDGRPFGATGETVFQGDQHGVYVFARSRRAAQGGRG